MTGYKVYWGEQNSAASVRNVGNATQADFDLTEGRSYFFYVVAYNSAGAESDPSATVTYTEPQTIQPPAAPSNLAGVAESSSQINLRWTDNSANETGFRLLRKLGAGGTYSAITLGAGATTYTDSNLTAGAQYFYKIQAFNNAGSSAYSVEISVTTQSNPPPPPPSAGAASFVRSDSTTSGSWVGAYGQDGGLASVRGYITSPDYVEIHAVRNYSLTWSTSTTDSRALQKPFASDRFAGAWHSTDSLEFYFRFVDSGTYQLGFYFVDFDRRGRKQLLELFDLDTGEILGAEMLSNFEQGRYSIWNIRGNVGARLTALAGPDCVMSAIFFDPVAAGTASFVGSDAVTSGAWIGDYGEEGGLFCPRTSDLDIPPYVDISAYLNYSLTWSESTSDTRALESVGGGSRSAGAWHSESELYFRFEFNDTAVHEVSFYFVDFNGAGRRQLLELFDDRTGNRIASAVLSNFESGVYFSYNLKGDVLLRLTCLSGPDAVLTGIFFDPAGPNYVEFIEADTGTSGTWKGTYGADGYNIALETPSLPAYSTITFSGATAVYWTANTTDARALQRPTQSGRVASAWTAPRQFSATVAMTDAVPHRVSLYFVDFDNKSRRQLVEIIDAKTGAALDSTELSDFRSGVWLTYDVTGDIVVRVTSLGNATAVLSGVLFD